ncbi:MAG: DUF3185 family protein [Cellvibrionaceae bacterium]
MNNNKLIGVVLLVIGVILLYFGWQSTQSVGEQLTEAVTGRFTGETIWYLVGGAAATVAGLYLALLRK